MLPGDQRWAQGPQEAGAELVEDGCRDVLYVTIKAYNSKDKILYLKGRINCFHTHP